jgi:nucleoid-associated protein YgaU
LLEFSRVGNISPFLTDLFSLFLSRNLIMKLGKQTKIGIAFVSALIIIVGIIVVKQLRSPTATTEGAALGDQAQKAASEGERHGKIWRPKQEENSKHNSLPATPPKVVPPVILAAKPPIELPREGNSGTTPVQGNPSPPDAGAGAMPLRPNLMPNPPKSEENLASQNSNPTAVPSLPAWPPQVPAEPSRPGDSASGTFINGVTQSEPLASSPPVQQNAGAGGALPPDSHGRFVHRQNDYHSPQDPRDRWADPPPENLDFDRSVPLRSLSKGAGVRSDGTYEVQPLDSFWTISEALYGTGAYFKALAEHNRGKGHQQESLKIGELISAPPAEELQQKYPELCPKPRHRETLARQALPVGTRHPLGGGRKYIVTEGDTLFDIARYELGKASRWVEIYELNREVLGKDVDYLIPGTELVLPGKSPLRSDPLTRRPAPWYQR